MATVLRTWAGRDVIVVGDAMLDEWRFADLERVCREAPAPVLAVRRTTDAAGGAANTAVNLARLGAHPVLVAPLGADAAGDRLRRCLVQAGVEDRTVPVAGCRTAVKRRLVASDQILMREDEGTSADLRRPAEVSQELVTALDVLAGASSAPVLVVCDYGLGALDDRVRDWLLRHRDRFPVVALDAHDLRPWRELGPTVITPSYAEAARVLDPAYTDGSRVSHALTWLGELLERTASDVAAVTLDCEGAVVSDRAGHTYRTDATPVPTSHTVGAGDAYLAAFTLAAAVEAPLSVAADLAQLAATLSVADIGTCVCDQESLLAAAVSTTRDVTSKVVDARRLVETVREHRRRNARVVFTNGCFDVLHRGHVAYLEQGRRLGDLLVVALNSDESVRRLKGPDRPVNRAADRAAVLAALSCVDLVVVFDQDSPAELIEAVRPDTYVKGGDYPPEMVPEAPVVRRLGGDVRILGYVPDRSTSAIIDRIRSRNQPVAAPDSGQAP